MSYLRLYTESHPIKSYVYDNKKIPVFLHIPKCAGTYTLSLISELLRAHSCFRCKKAPIKAMITFDIADRNYTYIKIYAVDEAKASRPYAEESSYSLDLSTFLNFYKAGGISIFAIATTAEIIKLKVQKNFNMLLNLLDKDYVFFTNLRTPYSRAFSMYKVHKRAQRNMGSFTLSFDEHSPEEFANFLICSDSEPSWVTQYLTYLFQNVEITLLDFAKSHISTVAYMDSLTQIKHLFETIYGKILTDYLDFLPEQVKQFNKRDDIALYSPSTLPSTVIESYKTLHKEDIELIKTLLPAAKYDSTESCLIEELNPYKAYGPQASGISMTEFKNV